MRVLLVRLLVAVFALVLGAAPLLAQSENTAEDPPGRVGRIARLSGSVSYHPGGGAAWEAAALNQPITSGSGVWTEPLAGAELEVGPSRIVLDAGTQFEIETLDDRAMVATLTQGGAYLRLRDIQPGETLTLRTPRGTVTIGQPGAYAVQAGDTVQPTLVTVLEGAAQVFGPGVSNLVAARQTLTVTGEGNFQAVLGPEQRSRLADGERVRERPIVVGPAAPPPILSQMTGGEALLETGSWEPAPEYGQVWYPPVPVGWVPYRNGRWSYVAPWGWTWVDEAPWGFAPFHYGRWRQFGSRWGWIPVSPGVPVYARPVYSPALVAFVGFGAGVATGLAINRPVGWVPLGPRDQYNPPYRASPTYIRRVNNTHITVNNITIDNRRGGPPDGYENRRGATAVPAGAMERSQPIARQARPMPQATLGAAQAMPEAPVRPTAGTAGVTPAVARQLGLPPAPPGASPRPAAPGPDLRPAAVAPAIPPGPFPRGARPIDPAPGAIMPPSGRPPLPALVPPGGPQAGRVAPPVPAGPVQPAVVQPAVMQPAVVQPPQARPGPPPVPGSPGGIAPPARTVVPPGPGVAAPPPQRLVPPVPMASPPGQAIAPVPQPAPPPVAVPMPQVAVPPVQRMAPPPQVAPPPAQRMVPPPQVAPAPVQQMAPPPQVAPPPVQRMAPPPVQRMVPPPQVAPPPVQQMAPPPVQRMAPPPPMAPPPVQRMAPPPQAAQPPAPRPSPPSPPPGRANCQGRPGC